MKSLVVKLAAEEGYQKLQNGYALACDALDGIESALDGDDKSLSLAKEQLQKGLDELKVANDWLHALKE